MIVHAAGAIWLNPFATVLLKVCSAVTVECYVMFCYINIFDMFTII